MSSTLGQAGRLDWYVRRFRSMTPSEVVWRGRRYVREQIPLRDRSTTSLLRPEYDWGMVADRFREGGGRPLLLDRSRAQAIAALHPEKVAALVAAAERVRAGYVNYFGYPEVRLANPMDWNRDPLHDFQWPSRRSAKINHRVATADPKWIWELNRLQHLPWLAEAWLFTGDDGFAQLALDHLDSWIDQNPVGQGIAWRGAFEAGIRAISVAVALQGLRDSDALTPLRIAKYVRMLAASADLCWRDRSRFSSANNHLVGELAGLATVAMLFPELVLAERWEKRAWRALTVESTRQVLPDGAGAEQAVGYQVFTAELILVVAALHRSRGGAPVSGLLTAIDRSADYLAAIVGDHDPDPRYGDDDEGFAMRLGPEPRRTVRDHLGVVAAFTGNERARRVGTQTLSALWLDAMTGSADTARLPERAPSPVSLVAPHGGLVVLRSGGRRLTMDIGSLGYLSIAAHGHADALAVTLSVDGQEVVGDPGAASYYGHPEWREIHRGTRVHPTVTVDRENQSVSGGPFLWNEHARVRVRAVDLERGIVDADHDGYQRLDHPVTHRRWLFAPPEENSMILIVDEISGSGEHEMRVSWPLHPSLGIEKVRHGHVATLDGEALAHIAIVATTEVTIDEVRGNEDDHLGWWSNQLETRVPSWLVGGVARGGVPMVMATVVRLSREEGSAVADPTVSLAGDLITTSWCSGEKRHAAVVDRSRAGAVELCPVVSAREWGGRSGGIFPRSG